MGAYQFEDMTPEAAAQYYRDLKARMLKGGGNNKLLGFCMECFDQVPAFTGNLFRNKRTKREWRLICASCTYDDRIDSKTSASE